MKKMNVKTWSSKKKVIFLTCLAFILVFVSAMSYGSVVNASNLKAVKKQSADDIETKTAQFVRNYVKSNGETIAPNGADVSGSIAKTVTTVTMDKMHSTNLTENDVNLLVKATEDAINSQAVAMGLDLSDSETKLFTSGVQSIVITSVYKAIADRGLVSVNDLDTLKKGLESRLSVCETVVSDETDNVYDVINQITQVVSDLETESGDSAVDIIELNDKIATLEEYVNSISSGSGDGDNEDGVGSTVTDVEIAIINNSIDSIKKAIEGIETKDDVQKKQLDDLSARLDEIQQNAGSEGGLTQDDLDALSASLNETSSLLSSDIDKQTKRIDSLNSSLSNLSDEFTSSLSSLQNAQSNTENILANITTEIAEGGAVDARIAQLCNEMAVALGADIEASNSSLTSKIDSLGSAVNNTQSSISDLESEFITVNVKITDLEEAQTEALSAAAADLQSKIDAAGSDISSLQTVSSNLENLIAGNRVNITSLTTSLDTAKSDLESAMAQADEAQKTELQELIASVENAQALVNESYEAQLQAIERQMTVKIEELETSQSEALSTAAAGLQSAIDSNNSDIESLQTANSALQDLISGNATDISSLSSSLDTAKSDLQKAMEEADEEQKAELETLIAGVESAQAAVNTTYSDKLSALETSISVQIEELKDEQSSALTAAAADLQGKIDATNTNVSSLQVASNNLQGLINGNATNISTLTSSLETAKTDLQAAMEEADEEQKEELKGLIQSVEDAQELINESYAAALVDVENKLTVKIDELEEAQSKALNDAAADLQGKIDASNTDIASLQTASSNLQNLINGNATDISDLTTSLATAKTDLETAMADADEEQKKELQELIASVEEAQSLVNESYEAQILGLEALINEKDSAQANALETAKNALTTQLNGLSDNLTTAKGDITTLQTSLSAVTTKAESNADSISEIETDVSDLNSGLSNVTSEVESVESAIQTMESDIETLSDTKAEITYDNSTGTPTLTITKISSQ